jgi:pyruvate dehydrogenase E1 component alpha subunit
MTKLNAEPNFIFSREEELKAFRDMTLIRRFEERCGQMYGEGLIAGFCHLYIGQEAVVVGMQMTIGEGDQVITAYRDHGHALMSGMDPKTVLAELTGRMAGASKGKGGSMHMFRAGPLAFMADTASLARRLPLAPVSHSPTNIVAMTEFA